MSGNSEQEQVLWAEASGQIHCQPGGAHIGHWPVFLHLVPWVSSPRGLWPLTPGLHLYTCGSSETSVGNIRLPFHHRPTFQIWACCPSCGTASTPSSQGGDLGHICFCALPISSCFNDGQPSLCQRATFHLWSGLQGFLLYLSNSVRTITCSNTSHLDRVSP